MGVVTTKVPSSPSFFRGQGPNSLGAPAPRPSWCPSSATNPATSSQPSDPDDSPASVDGDSPKKTDPNYPRNMQFVGGRTLRWFWDIPILSSEIRTHSLSLRCNFWTRELQERKHKEMQKSFQTLGEMWKPFLWRKNLGKAPLGSLTHIWGGICGPRPMWTTQIRRRNKWLKIGIPKENYSIFLGQMQKDTPREISPVENKW